MAGLFDAAKSRILSDLEHYFPDGESRNGEWWWRRRQDDKTPSCHAVGDTAACKDFGDDSFRGSVLDAYAEARGMSAKDAAKEIVPDAAERPRASRTKEKSAPVLPVPLEAVKALTPYVRSEWAVEHYGECVLGATYKDAEGRVLFCVARYEKAGKKEIRPYYYGENGKWNEGQALTSDRPVLHLPELLACALPVLVVEGEKCAAVTVPGHIVVTWAGGASTVDRTDWAPLIDRAVTIWPDADSPGYKAASAIQKRLPHARVLQIEGRPQGWDIADAQANGIDLAAFIRDCPMMEMPGDAGARLPFSFLGFDTARYWFLPRRRRVPFTIDMGHFTASQLLELASLQWWGMQNLIRDNGAIKTDAAQDWIVDEQEKAGMVDLRHLRGAGVWRDGDEIVVNDGAQIVTMAGERLEYDAFKSTAGAEYIPSETRFGDMTGEESTDAEGVALAILFGSLKFARRLDPVAALGWALIAPFGGILAWRPHLWITGRKATGKSTVLIEKMIDPLIGEFAYQGTGRSSEAGLRRAAHLMARPIRLDEFDARGKSDTERLSRITILARNAVCDSTAVTTLAAGDSDTVTFIVRSCFLFASVSLLDVDSAIESRIVRVEKLALSPGEIQAELQRMKRECGSVMADPSRYRRRIFRALPRILADIDAVHDRLLPFVGDSRECDVIAPLLCAAWAVQSGESIMDSAGGAWMAGLMDDFVRVHQDRVEDEDRVIEHICAAKIRMDGGREKAVAELISDADDPTASGAEAGAQDILSRHGIRFTHYANGDGTLHRALAIAVRADPISQMLAGTPYVAGYDAQLKRNALDRGDKYERFKIGVRKCRLLDWEGVREKYLGAEAQGRLEGTA